MKMEMREIGISFCPLICFEDTLADLGRQAGRLRPDLLINITNDSWFKNLPGSGAAPRECHLPDGGKRHADDPLRQHGSDVCDQFPRRGVGSSP